TRIGDHPISKEVGMAHPPLGELLAEFDTAQRRRGISPRTIRNRRYRIRALARDVEPRHVLDLDTRDLERWLDGLGVSNGSRATYIDHLRAFYRWATREGHISVSPAVEVEAPKLGRRLPRPIDDDDLARAFETANPRMRAMLSLMAFEGARCIEVSRLRGEEIGRASCRERVGVTVGAGRRRHTRFSRDWSSDVCSSDLATSVFHLPWRWRHPSSAGGSHARSTTTTSPERSKPRTRGCGRCCHSWRSKGHAASRCHVSGGR